MVERKQRSGQADRQLLWVEPQLPWTLGHSPWATEESQVTALAVQVFPSLKWRWDSHGHSDPRRLCPHHTRAPQKLKTLGASAHLFPGPWESQEGLDVSCGWASVPHPPNRERMVKCPDLQVISHKLTSHAESRMATMACQDDGQAVRGNMHLPTYARHSLKQQLVWGRTRCRLCVALGWLQQWTAHRFQGNRI